MRFLLILLPLLAAAALAAAGGALAVLATFEAAAGRASVLGSAWLGLAGASLLCLLTLALVLRLRAAPALDEAVPAVGFHAQVSPNGQLHLTRIGAGIERLTGWTAEAALRPSWRQRGIDATTLPLGPDLPARLLGAEQASTEYRFRRADGGWMWLRETARVLSRGPGGIEIAGALEDISAERELALQAAAVAKFATLGEMAASLAHELNQPIAIMSLAAENAAEALESGADGVEDALARLRRIMAQADRAKAIVSQLRDFSRVDVAALQPVDLGAAVHGMLVLANQALRDARVRLDVSVPDLLPRVTGQVVLVEQVLLNLVLNARDALLERPAAERRLHIRAEPRAAEVVLVVVDNGPGISAEMRERLFDPFTTSKPPGLGTGLGLSISRSIMRGLGGRIEAGNAPAGGAEFTLVFRRADVPSEAPAERALA